MFKLDDKDIKRFEKDLKAFASKAYPYATRNTINQAAFNAQKQAKRDIQVKMVQRNKFTVQSVRVEKSKSLHVNQQAATVGSIADYLADQEFGATKVKRGKHGVAIPTGYSAGQEGQQPRTRLPRKPNKLGNVKLRRHTIRAKSRKAHNVALIKQAAATGTKFVYLHLNKSTGIFKITGGKRRPRIKMVYDLSRPAVRIPRNPWLKPAVDHVAVTIPKLYKDSLIFQARRAGLFR